MALTGTVKSYNPHKGWGFVECNGQDSFLNKKELKGFCVSKGDSVKFDVAQGEKGAFATNVSVMLAPEEVTYFGEIKRFNPSKGFGFITCEAFPGQDCFVLRSELPGGFGPEGGHCRFKVTMEEKGPAAKEVQLLGAAGDQAQQMKAMMGWGKGWGKGYGKGKSDDRTCWDVKKTGTCPRGAECKFEPCCNNNK
eukprot:TRINITY_DN97335_c0_g1_i1.p1 TRINITY_DN97335_c0_g1~~TRINITY_DN97335_c0_g1_i1.p1  ORF type:complete len:194 (+),score=66.44 TRINITY_DN97335_c0_g1_i1:78-659(+)